MEEETDARFASMSVSECFEGGGVVVMRSREVYAVRVGKRIIGFNAIKGLGMTYVVCIQDRTNPLASSSSSS